MFHYLIMQTGGDVQVGKLYPEYRDFYESTDLTTVEQLAHLRRFGEIYRSLDTVSDGSCEATFMYRLRQMDVTTMMPFILRLKGDSALAAEDYECILHDLESYLVRRMVCQLSVKSYNQLAVDLLKAVSEDGLTPQVVRDRMLTWSDPSSVWPDDVAFHNAWMEYETYRWIAQAKVRMLFEALEPVVKSDKAEDCVLIQQALTIEHLMPQSWAANYPLEAGEDPEAARVNRDRLVHTLGNLTLLTQKLNSSVSNGAWSRLNDEGVDEGKRDAILLHSNLGINSMLLKTKGWDESAIRHRGEQLYESAKKLWPWPQAH
jgi:hypothetical protein